MFDSIGEKAFLAEKVSVTAFCRNFFATDYAFVADAAVEEALVLCLAAEVNPDVEYHCEPWLQRVRSRT